MDSAAQEQTEGIVESTFHFGQRVLVITSPNNKTALKIDSLQSIAFISSDKSSRFVRGYIVKHDDEGVISIWVKPDQVDKIIYQFDCALGASYD